MPTLAKIQIREDQKQRFLKSLMREIERQYSFAQLQNIYEEPLEIQVVTFLPYTIGVIYTTVKVEVIETVPASPADMDTPPDEGECDIIINFLTPIFCQNEQGEDTEVDVDLSEVKDFLSKFISL